VNHNNDVITVYTRVQVAKFTTKSWCKSSGGNLYAGHKIKNFF